MDEKKRPIILIVDDVPANIDILGDMLQDGHEISVATNGEDAIRICRQSPQPDLLLLDVMMPGMNGYEVCETLKKFSETCDIPVIFITARKKEEDETTGLQLGAVDYIRKPFNTATVKARVMTHLDLKLHRNMLEETNQQLREALLLARQSEKERLQREKLQGVLEMAGAVCHELNQPMQVVSSCAELLSDHFSQEDPIYKKILTIQEHIAGMADMTQKLMRITRYETKDYVLNTKIIDIDKAST